MKNDRYKKVILFLTLFVFVLFCSNPLLYALGNIRMGPWEIHPYINIEETYDDNIYLEDSNEKDDWIITISPGLRINGELREHEFAIEYRAEFLDYSDYKSNDTDKHYFGGSAKFRFPEGWSLNIKENFVKTYDPATSEQTALEDRTRNDVSIILGYDKTENLNFELG